MSGELVPRMVRVTLPRLAWALLCLLAASPHVDTYSRGAPDSACTDNMMPRHGFDVQVTKPQTRHCTVITINI